MEKTEQAVNGGAPAVRRLRQENHSKFEVKLGYTARPCLKLDSKDPPKDKGNWGRGSVVECCLPCRKLHKCGMIRHPSLKP